MDRGRGMFCPFCGKHMSSLTRFCFTCGRCLEFLKDADQTEHQTYCINVFNILNEGHSYAVIVDMMSSLHGVNISLRTLKVNWTKPGCTAERIIPLQTPWVTPSDWNFVDLDNYLATARCGQVLKQKYNFRVKRDYVMNLLRELNPRGCESRTRRRFTRRTYHSMGPNYIGTQMVMINLSHSVWPYRDA